ncbi:MAG: ParB/RepB/Spo0J family partition protein [Oscillospiraceae bacterium]|nr:ParB/RepB/Spo0J family partition protein [Oscillospiraceae bacterium]MDD6503032.1 ParB/RepB/Spo0J family partition protein [Oscillospiraceae bacterium]MDY4104381.1 ParB/RepB/Spo0J family partition protein [Oscillospiraceae bacterium]
MASNSKKGLGTGLGALLGGDIVAESGAKQATLPIAKVEPKADQPRSHFDEVALRELSDSIAQHGMIQPITVRKLPTGYYQIIAGERRWRAARMAGLTEVPVNIIEADDRLAAELALVENLQRTDLNPVEEARGYQTLIKVYGLTQEEAAQSVGKSRPAVTNAMRLLALPEEVLTMLEAGELSAGHARALLAIEDDAVKIEAAKLIVAKGMSVRQTEALAVSLGRKKEKEDKKPAGIDYLALAAKQLEDSLGRRVKMTEGKNGGKIEIDYYDADDREALMDALRSIGNRLPRKNTNNK